MITYWIVNWVLSALLLLIVARVVPGFEISGCFTALIAVIIIGLINATLGLVLRVVTFPLTIITFGLFLLVVNAIVLKIAAAVMPGFSIRGFVPALIGSVLISLLHVLLRMFVFPQRAAEFSHHGIATF